MAAEKIEEEQAIEMAQAPESAAAESAKKSVKESATEGTKESANESAETGKRDEKAAHAAKSRTASRTSENRSRAGDSRAATESRPRNRELQAWINEMPEGNTRHYLESRILPQMDWYAKKSGECKKRYQYLMWVSIGVGALIPVFSVFADGGLFMKAFLALLGSVVTAVNALLALHTFKDLWVTYRNTREKMLQTLYYYFNGIGVFAGDDQAKKDAALIKTLETMMTEENSGWQAILEK